jgi:predicted O-methyltransferase YrrM
MAQIFEADDWQRYVMRWHDPHCEIEPLQREIGLIDAALDALVEAGVLPHTRYDTGKMLAHRAAVRERFDIPWTAISPRMQRLLYAINAIAQPRVMVAVGIFCGNTFISNAGAAIGPGATYRAEHLVGLEIRPREADRARRNVATLVDDHGRGIAGDRVLTGDDTIVEIIGGDGIPWLNKYQNSIDVLYLDADGPRGKGKSIYLDLVQAAERILRPGSLVLAHNSVNDAHGLIDYLQYVRDPAHFRESANMIVDNQGLEISVR